MNAVCDVSYELSFSTWKRGKKVSNGETADGPGTLAPYHIYLASLGAGGMDLKVFQRFLCFGLLREPSRHCAEVFREDKCGAERHYLAR